MSYFAKELDKVTSTSHVVRTGRSFSALELWQSIVFVLLQARDALDMLIASYVGSITQHQSQPQPACTASHSLFMMSDKSPHRPVEQVLPLHIRPPLFRNGFNTIKRARQTAIDGPDSVCIIT